jgi:hypothetical protein
MGYKTFPTITTLSFYACLVSKDRIVKGENYGTTTYVLFSNSSRIFDIYITYNTMNMTHSTRLQQSNASAAGLLGAALGAFTMIVLSNKTTRQKIREQLFALRDHVQKRIDSKTILTESIDTHIDEKPRAG